VDVEDVEEDSESGDARSFRFDGDDFSIGRSNGYTASGDFPLGIAKEVEAEQSEQPQRHGEPWSRHPKD
jgi:hypothetical protein